MPLIFSLPELIAMASSVLLTVILSNDGDTNWFEGATLLAAYFIMAIGFFLYNLLWIRDVFRENTMEK